MSEENERGEQLAAVVTPYASVEEYARHVHGELFLTIGALCGKFGPTHPITLTIANLNAEAGGIVARAQMSREVATEPDLKALNAMVRPDVASDSETFWELED